MLQAEADVGAGVPSGADPGVVFQPRPILVPVRRSQPATVLPASSMTSRARVTSGSSGSTASRLHGPRLRNPPSPRDAVALADKYLSEPTDPRLDPRYYAPRTTRARNGTLDLMFRRILFAVIAASVLIAVPSAAHATPETTKTTVQEPVVYDDGMEPTPAPDLGSQTRHPTSPGFSLRHYASLVPQPSGYATNSCWKQQLSSTSTSMFVAA